MALALSLLFGLGMVALLLWAMPKGPKAVVKLTPADERKFEFEITKENVQDVLNFTIEEGIDHPLLAQRKATN